MEKENTAIIVIIAIIAIAMFVLPRLDLGLFTTTTICSSNEPENISDYNIEDMKDITVCQSDDSFNVSSCRLKNPYNNKSIGLLCHCGGDFSTFLGVFDINYYSLNLDYRGNASDDCRDYVEKMSNMPNLLLDLKINYKGVYIYPGDDNTYVFCSKNNKNIIILSRTIIDNYIDKYYSCQNEYSCWVAENNSCKEMVYNTEPTQCLTKMACESGVVTSCSDVGEVCGVDGNTYFNICNANIAGVEVDYKSECGSCTFTIGETCIKLWMLLLAGGGVVILLYMMKKK